MPTSPAHRSSTITTATNLTSPITVIAPAGIQNNDILELHLYLEELAITVTPPSGFTLKETQIIPSGNLFRKFVWWKRASGESGNYQISHSGASPWAQAMMAAYSGAKATGDPYHRTAALTATTGVNPPPIELHPQIPDCLLIYAAAHWSTGTFSGYSGGGLTWTERQDASDLTLATAPQTVAESVTVNATATAGTTHTVWLAALEPVIGIYDQEGYRWRNDDGTEATATWKAAQDTNITLPSGGTARLRLLLNATDDPYAIQPALEFRKTGETSWRKVPD